MSTPFQLSAFFATILTMSAFSLPSRDANAAPPTRMQHFTSSSGRTIIEYFAYNSGPCGAGLLCNFRDRIRVPAGFDQVEVFLSGFKLEAANQSDTLMQVKATVTKHHYETTTGELELSIAAALDTGTGQNYSYEITFVVVLTGATTARFTSISTGCNGIARCRIVGSFPAAVPAGMHYIGIATQNWHIGSRSGPLTLNTLSGHQDGLAVQPPFVGLEYLCAMEDAAGANGMFCEWGAKVIAFDSNEMEQNGSPIFPQYTFISWNTSMRRVWIEHSRSLSRAPIAGFLDAFEGLTLSYLTFPYGPRVQNPVWLVESSASGFQTMSSALDTALTTYGIFLGTEFGNYTMAQKYGFQESRAFGFLR